LLTLPLVKENACGHPGLGSRRLPPLQSGFS
jgi:hypothetical protein